MNRRERYHYEEMIDHHSCAHYAVVKLKTEKISGLIQTHDLCNTDQLPDGLIAQLEEHCTGIPEVMGTGDSQ